MSQSVKAYEGLYAQTLQLANEYGITPIPEGQLQSPYGVAIQAVCSDGTYDISHVIRGESGVVNGKIFQLDNLNGSFGSLNNALIDTTDPCALGVWGQTQVQNLQNLCSVFGFTYNGPGLNKPLGMKFDSSGNLYIADSSNNRILKATMVGGNIHSISLVAGNGENDYGGDGYPAISAVLSSPQDVAVDNNGNTYIADEGNNLLRYVTNTGIIYTFDLQGYNSYGLLVSGDYLYFTTDFGIRRSKLDDRSKLGVVFAGPSTGYTRGYSGDGGPATSALFNIPTKLAADSLGNIYVVDYGNNAIRVIINTSGATRYTLAGIDQTWTNGYIYTVASVTGASCLAINSQDALYVYSSSSQTVYSVSNLVNTAVVGGGHTNGDGDTPTNTNIGSVGAMVFDSNDNLYMACGDRIRKSDGSIVTTLG